MRPKGYRYSISCFSISFLLGICLITASTASVAQSALKSEPQSRLAHTKSDLATIPTSAQVADPNYIIGPEDVISVNVWHEPEVSRAVPVRNDGKISLPLIGEVMASGLTPTRLQADIETKLKAYITGPDVTVIVQDMRSQHLNVLGSVVKPGVYHYAPPMTLLDAIALSGGLSDFAKIKKMYVIRYRPDGTTERIRVNYKEALKGLKPSANLELQARDTVVVP